MACGIIGTYIVIRRISYIADGIAHAVLGGMGAALYLHKVYHWDGVLPIHGALVAAIIAAIIIGLVSLWAKQREDTVISALWAVGMAAGIIFISQTPGYNEDLMGYLFGNILMVSSSDLWMLAGLDAIIVIIGLLFYNQFLAVCFDQEFARVRGLNVELFYLLLLGLAALTVVVLATVVGIVMVIALLTLPIGYCSTVLYHYVAYDDHFNNPLCNLHHLRSGIELWARLSRWSHNHHHCRRSLPRGHDRKMGPQSWEGVSVSRNLSGYSATLVQNRHMSQNLRQIDSEFRFPAPVTWTGSNSVLELKAREVHHWNGLASREQELQIRRHSAQP